tara:strand:- start:1779 stop:2162 length:384 start_codon:yes stop_codon:yes gene_type:complete
MSQELWKSYFETGLESAKAGLIETAVDYFEWAAKIKPDNHEIQYNLGVSFMTLGKMNDAIKVFTEAIIIDHTNSDALANRAICYAYIGDKINSEKDIKLAAKHGSIEAGIRQAVKLVEDKRKKEKKN